jgi:septation ring formation regulator
MIINWRAKTITIVVLILLFNLISVSAYATPFPEREEAYIVDPFQYFEQPDRTTLREYILNQPHEYVVVFLDQIEQDGFDYARDLFDYYELGSDSILFVITIADNSQLYYAYGSSLIEQGLSDETIESRKLITYQPYVIDRNYLTGVRSLIQSIERELLNIAEERERAEQLIINNPDVEIEPIQESSSSLPWWVILLIIIFVGMVLFMIFSFFFRRRITKQVDQLENWKIQLENRPFSSQLARVKGLKMAGETEIRFDKWKSEWEVILTTTLPDIEETLIDIEELADSYRFIKSVRMIEETKSRLKEIDLSLDKIVLEIDELTSSEKGNKEKVSKLHEQYQEIKTALSKQSMGLGVSYPVWNDKFAKTTSWFDQFNKAQEGGDYLSANDLLEAIESVFKQLKEAFQIMPGLIQEVEEKIPAQILELEKAITEMDEKGFQLAHTDVEKRTKQLKKKKKTAIPYMENGQIKELKQLIHESLEEVDALFGLLEEEVESKGYVLSTMDLIPEQIKEVKETYHRLKEESRLTKNSYSWESEWEEELLKITEGFTEIEELSGKLEDNEVDVEQSYPALKPAIIHFQEKRLALMDRMNAFDQMIKELREEELKVRDIALRLRQTVIKIKVTLRKSNLPGIPEHLDTGLIMAEEAVEELNEKLAAVPLEMNRVQHHLKEAKTQVESVTQVAKSIIQQAVKAERYIQFGNRYRRRHPACGNLLDESEVAFRRLQYREATELAEEALDLADKNWREELGEEESTG